jgi:hypothetical protein
MIDKLLSTEESAEMQSQLTLDGVEADMLFRHIHAQAARIEALEADARLGRMVRELPKAYWLRRLGDTIWVVQKYNPVRLHCTETVTMPYDSPEAALAAAKGRSGKSNE